MVLGIGNVKRIAVKSHSLRTVQTRLGKLAISRAPRAAADGLYQRAVKFGDNDAIVIRIGDEESIAFGVGQDFSREGKRQVANPGALKRKSQRLFIQLATLAEVLDALGRRFMGAAILIFTHGRTVASMASTARRPPPMVSRTSWGAVA